MIKQTKKFVRCQYMNKNIWVILEIEKNAQGEELLLCMTCKQKDLLKRKNLNCEVGCKNYFYADQ